MLRLNREPPTKTPMHHAKLADHAMSTASLASSASGGYTDSYRTQTQRDALPTSLSAAFPGFRKGQFPLLDRLERRPSDLADILARPAYTRVSGDREKVDLIRRTLSQSEMRQGPSRTATPAPVERAVSRAASSIWSFKGKARTSQASVHHDQDSQVAPDEENASTLAGSIASTAPQSIRSEASGGALRKWRASVAAVQAARKWKRAAIDSGMDERILSTGSGKPKPVLGSGLATIQGGFAFKIAATEDPIALRRLPYRTVWGTLEVGGIFIVFDAIPATTGTTTRSASNGIKLTVA